MISKLQGKVLVTGGTGFVGKALMHSLLQNECGIVAVSRRPMPRCESSHQRVQWVTWDQVSAPLLSEVSAIVHLATCYGRQEPPSEVYLSNVVLPLDLACKGAAAGVGLFINTSSYFFRADDNYPYLPDYRASKRAFSAALKRLGAATAQLKVVEMQLEHPYGPDDPADRFCAQVFDSFLQNKACLDCTAGEQVRDFIHVADVADAYLAVLLQAHVLEKWRHFELGTGQAHSLRGFIETVQRISGRATQPNFGVLPYRPHEIMWSVANNGPLKDLGWHPRFTLEQGVQDVLMRRPLALGNRADALADALQIEAPGS